MVEICGRCRNRYVRALHSGDYVHACNTNDVVLKQEDVVVIGAWTDYSGNGGKSKYSVMYAGVDNDLQGTEAGVEGAKFGGVTPRGANESTHRQRDHLEYIPPKDEEEPKKPTYS